LAPVQAVVAPITTEAMDYANQILAQMQASGLRVELDDRNEKINYKIREHSLKKVPYIFVVGKREADERTVAIRELGGESQKVMLLDEAIVMMNESAKFPG
jgi:threonyl-tRNA synthetase